MVQQDGIWYIQCGELLVISVPHDVDLRTLIISHYHSPPCRGHGGLAKTKDLIERHFHWHGLYTQVKKFIDTCEFCQRNKSSNQAPAGPLQPIAPPDQPFDTISMDLIVDLPVDKTTGDDSILVIVDKLTKMAKFLSCRKTVGSTAIAEMLYSKVFAVYGKPAQLITDRDPRFTGNFFREWCSGLNIKQCFTSAYHPQSDGQTERMNRILEDYLRNYVNPQGDDWVKYLPSAEFAINNAYQESIRTSPFFLNLGRHPNAVEGLEAFLPKVIPNTRAHVFKVQEATDVRRRIQDQTRAAQACLQAAHDREKLWVQARGNIEEAQQRQKKHYDKHRREVVYQEGDQVLLSTRNAGRRSVLSTKFLPTFVGPFKVLSRVGDVAYKLELPQGIRWHNVFHVSLLKPYKQPTQVGTMMPQPPPLPPVIDGDMYYAVEDIVGHKVKAHHVNKKKHHDDPKRKGKATYLYLVKWAGYPSSDNSWEPVSNFAHNAETRAMLSAYKERNGLK